MRLLLAFLLLVAPSAFAQQTVFRGSNSFNGMSLGNVRLHNPVITFSNVVNTNVIWFGGVLITDVEPSIYFNNEPLITYRQDVSIRQLIIGHADEIGLNRADEVSLRASQDSPSGARIGLMTFGVTGPINGLVYYYTNETNFGVLAFDDGTSTGFMFRSGNGNHWYGSAPRAVFLEGSLITAISNITASAALATSPVTVAVAADNQVVSTTNRSFIKLTSDAAASSRTIILTPSNIQGALLHIMFSGSNGAEMLDDQAQTGGGTTRTAGTLTFTDHDVVTFIFEGTDWRQAAALLTN